jgi:hypothetical protein
MTALPIGTIEVVVKNAQGQPLARVQLTLRLATGRIVKTATSRPIAVTASPCRRRPLLYLWDQRGFATAVGAARG